MSETAIIRGARIAYEQAGAGPELIWGHGLSQTRADESVLGLVDWARIPARVTRYDARGHGESETTPDLGGYSWAELAADQLALAEHLDIGAYVVAGASMGCGTALHVAVQAPERVRALVLAIPPTAWETRAAQADLWAQSAALIESDGVEAVIAARALLDPPDPFRDDPDYRERGAAATRRWDPTRLAHVMRGAAGADFPPRDELATISAPTLILAWTGDPVHPIATADELNRLIPHAERHDASTAAELATWTDRIAAFIR
jgi:pimeloyl-ACP methyl ester carboxylesterase